MFSRVIEVDAGKVGTEVPPWGALRAPSVGLTDAESELAPA
jgi:hypothetical protein